MPVSVVYNRRYESWFLHLMIKLDIPSVCENGSVICAYRAFQCSQSPAVSCSWNWAFSVRLHLLFVRWWLHIESKWHSKAALTFQVCSCHLMLNTTTTFPVYFNFTVFLKKKKIIAMWPFSLKWPLNHQGMHTPSSLGWKHF